MRQSHAEIIEAIHDEGLMYPVTVIEDRLCCDGAVSYPAVMRGVEALLAERSRA